MTTQKEALRMALEALDALCINDYSGYELGKRDAHLVDNALTAIKKALAQPEREWVGLTYEERNDLYEKYHDQNGLPKQGYPDGFDYERAIEAKLKQKNGYAEEKNT